MATADTTPTRTKQMRSQTRQRPPERPPPLPIHTHTQPYFLLEGSNLGALIHNYIHPVRLNRWSPLQKTMALLSLNSNKLHHNLRVPPPSPFTTPEFGPNLAISKSKMVGWRGGGVAKVSTSFCNPQHLEKTTEVYRGWGGQFPWQIKAVRVGKPS